MGEETKIAWCDSTFNPWIGCTKVSPACANCYAETLMDTRWNRVKWGKGQPRQRTSSANWKQPLAWEKQAAHTGIRRTVFCGSLCDWLDEEVPVEWLADLLDLIRQTPNLDWLLLTKRPELWHCRIYNAYTPDVTGDNLPLLQWMGDWLCAWEEARGFSLPPHHRGKRPPLNVWIGVTVENQEMADKRIPELLKIPARVRFLSCEPLLGAVNMRAVAYIRAGGQTIIDALTGHMPNAFSGTKPSWPRIDWVICGGESGPKARPMHPDWARSLRDQCKAAGVPFFFKQWGEWAPDCLHEWPPCRTIDRPSPGSRGVMFHCGKTRAGHLLDGVEHHEFERMESEDSHE